MAKDIPGYYYDAEKGKYFKVQPNHTVPSAAKYSKQAVDAQRATAKQRKLDNQARTRRLRETTQRSTLLQDPFPRLWLRTALDGTSARPHVTTEVVAYYAASLSRTTVINGSPGLFHKFAVDDVTGAMITASSWVKPFFTVRRGVGAGARWIGHHFVHHWPHSQRQSSILGPYTGLKYGILPAEEAVSALLITPRPLNSIVWATPASGHNPGCIRIVPFDQSLEGAGVGEGSRGQHHGHDDDNEPQQRQQGASDEEFTYTGDLGIRYTIRECDIWALAASPSGQRIVAGCSSGFFYFNIELTAAQQQQQPPPPTRSDWGSTLSRRGAIDDEFVTVAFKDEHVVFLGTRSGAVHVSDLRSNSIPATATRLRHPSGVTALRALSNDNYVVVRGLQTMSIYDLRYTPMAKTLSKPYMTFRGGPGYASDRFGLGFDYDPGLGLIATGAYCSYSCSYYCLSSSLLSFDPCTSISLLVWISSPHQAPLACKLHNGNTRQGSFLLYSTLKTTRETHAHSSPTSTTPLTQPTSTPTNPTPASTNHISLFSTRTGALVPSPINTHAFPEPVTCIQFTNAVRKRSNAAYSTVYSSTNSFSSFGDNDVPSFVGDEERSNNEPKSIVTASGGVIDEWTVQGLGLAGEDGRQE